MSDLLIPVALDESDRIVHAHEGARGRRFRCPGCKGEVTWRQGSVVRSHFAHRPDEGCGESAIHSAAKLLVAQTINDWRSGTALRPMLSVACTTYQCGSTERRPLQAPDEEAGVEVTLPSGLRPDVLLGDFAIEICHRHPIDADKIASFKRDGIGWIELEAAPLLEDPPRWQLLRGSTRVEPCWRCLSSYRQKQRDEAKALETQLEGLRRRIDQQNEIAKKAYYDEINARGYEKRLADARAELEVMQADLAKTRAELASATQASRALSDAGRLEEIKKAKSAADVASTRSVELRKAAEEAMADLLNVKASSLIKPGVRVRGWGRDGVVRDVHEGWVYWAAADGTEWASRAQCLEVLLAPILSFEKIPA